MTRDIDTLHLQQFADYLKPRPRDWHKGNAGHVLVVGGDLGFLGAVCLAAVGALRVGAGLVSVATRPEHASCVNMNRPEIMSHGIAAGDALKTLLSKATVVIVGPGLGQTPWAQALLSVVLESRLPLVVDADALNLLASHPRDNEQWILTPHPGEAARLLGVTVQTIQMDRLSAIHALQAKYQGICVLKGAGSLVLGIDTAPAICLAGNPGMATAGMGDILSGVIAGLLAQGLPSLIAAKLGVLLHAMAGDLAATEGQRGMIATDLLPFLRCLVNGIHD